MKIKMCLWILGCNATSMFQRSTVSSTTAHPSVYLAQLIITIPSRLSGSISILQRMLIMQWIIRMNMIKWQPGWSDVRRYNGMQCSLNGNSRSTCRWPPHLKDQLLGLHNPLYSMSRWPKIQLEGLHSMTLYAIKVLLTSKIFSVTFLHIFGNLISQARLYSIMEGTPWFHSSMSLSFTKSNLGTKMEPLLMLFIFGWNKLTHTSRSYQHASTQY